MGNHETIRGEKGNPGQEKTSLEREWKIERREIRLRGI